jgi:hypothetical protein
VTDLAADWTAMLTDHDTAVAEFVTAARRFPGEAWSRALVPGKWSPSEIASHVIEAYEVLGRELNGEPGMRLLGSSLQRWVLRHTILAGILRGRPFPAGARAPRETRPRELHVAPASAFAALGITASRFAQELAARAGDGRLRLSHAYFGPMSAKQSLQLAAVHTRHHARQLEAAAR